jgi:hypothetical protein
MSRRTGTCPLVVYGRTATTGSRRATWLCNRPVAENTLNRLPAGRLFRDVRSLGDRRPRVRRLRPSRLVPLDTGTRSRPFNRYALVTLVREACGGLQLHWISPVNLGSIRCLPGRNAARLG